MRICHVTPHLPPDQAANALLPYHLGRWAGVRGDVPCYIAHHPRAAQNDAAPPASDLPGPVTWIAPRERRAGTAHVVKLGGLSAAWRIGRQAYPVIAAADVVHLHSSGLLTEVCALVAGRLRKPVVLTLYGTEIWHYDRRRRWPDLFTRAYRRAAAVTFYSRALMDRAVELGLGRPELQVVYPPVAPEFRESDAAGQAAARATLGLSERHVLVNVKRLHPLAGQRFLIEALPDVLERFPDCRLIICGSGELLPELRALAEREGVGRHVTFAGLVDNEAVARYDMAADAFILPSLLEACPTVALEALACGTPVVSSDNPGGVELNALFGADVAVVPREDVRALARAMIGVLESPRRVAPATSQLIQRDFRPGAVDAIYREIYVRALDRARRA